MAIEQSRVYYNKCLQATYPHFHRDPNPLTHNSDSQYKVIISIKIYEKLDYKVGIKKNTDNNRKRVKHPTCEKS